MFMELSLSFPLYIAHSYVLGINDFFISLIYFTEKQCIIVKNNNNMNNKTYVFMYVIILKAYISVERKEKSTRSKRAWKKELIKF